MRVGTTILLLWQLSLQACLALPGQVLPPYRKVFKDCIDYPDNGAVGVCSGHGHCGSNHACVCHSKWHGPFCDTRLNSSYIANETTPKAYGRLWGEDLSGPFWIKVTQPMQAEEVAEITRLKKLKNRHYNHEKEMWRTGDTVEIRWETNWNGPNAEVFLFEQLQAPSTNQLVTTVADYAPTSTKWSNIPNGTNGTESLYRDYKAKGVFLWAIPHCFPPSENYQVVVALPAWGDNEENSRLVNSSSTLVQIYRNPNFGSDTCPKIKEKKSSAALQLSSALLNRFNALQVAMH